MAAKKKTTKLTVTPESQYLSKQEFKESIGALVGEIRGLIREEIDAVKIALPATPAEVSREKDIVAAAPNKYTVNPEWEEIAGEIVGEALDHTEIEYAKGGGMKFTIVVKTEMSNASPDYLERNKVDRRTREIGAEGEAGVKNWCQLVASNLKRPKPTF